MEQNRFNFVLNNSVDKDVQSMFLPLNLLQYLMCCPKYRINNDIIIPNGYFSCFISMLGALVFIFTIAYRTYLLYINQDFFEFTTFMFITSLYDCIYYLIGFSMNFLVSMVQTKNSVKFVLTFQRVHRFLNNETVSRAFVIWNWIYTIVAFFGHIVVFTYFGIILNSPFLYIYLDYILISFDLNILFAIRVIKLLEDKVVQWNVQALNSYNINETLRHNYYLKMFQTYVEILQCYDLFKSCFQILILYYIIEGFSHSLFYVQISIQTIKTGNSVDEMDDAILGSVYILVWLTKDMVWQIILSKQCEKFYIAVESVQDCCALILKSNCPDEEKLICKNVLRLHRASFSKIRVCGLFYLDAALQLSLMSLFTNYTIVLLQFAFL